MGITKFSIWRSKNTKQNKSNSQKSTHEQNISKKIDEESDSSPFKNFLSIAKLEIASQNIYGGIVRDKTAEGGLKYVVLEPYMSEKDLENFELIKKILMTELMVDLGEIKSKSDAERRLRKKIIAIINNYGLEIPKRKLNKILYYAIRDFIYLGKIEPLMHDHMIEEISCDGINVPLYIWHREFESVSTNIIFSDEKSLEDYSRKLAYASGKNISKSNPIVDSSLPDGSRINLTFGTEITKKGSTFTIRKFRSDPITIIDLMKFNTLNSDLAAYLWYITEKRRTMMISGGTASGKTTTLNTISAFITPGQKIVTIEDTPELNIPHQNWIPAVARQTFTGSQTSEITQFDLLRAALRQRPDIIIVGETRGKEAYTLFQAMSTGHGGASSIHADSVTATITRLTSDPMNVPRILIANTLDLIVLQLKLKLGNKTVRRVVQVSEIVGQDQKSGELLLNDVFTWNPLNDTHTFSGRSTLLEKMSIENGISNESIYTELDKRKMALEWMMRNNIIRHKEVSDTILEFYADPEKFYERKRILA